MIDSSGHLVALLGLALLTAVGCGSRVAYAPPLPRAVDPPLELHVSFEEAWSAVIQTFFDRNIPVRTLEKASGLLESEELHGEIGRDCDCGTWLGVPIAGYGAYGGDAFYRFRVLVKRVQERETSLSVRSSCRGQTDRVEGELICRLSAAKEQEIGKAISAGAMPAR